MTISISSKLFTIESIMLFISFVIATFVLLITYSRINYVTRKQTKTDQKG